jgi:XTP/dITP diphosphohydrolase
MSVQPALTTLILGTHNKKKCAELRLLLEPLGLKLLSLADLATAIEVDEVGSTFSENARLKAIEYANHLQLWFVCAGAKW